MEAVHRVTAPEGSEMIDKQLSHIEPPTQEDMDAWISGKIKWSDIPEIKKAMGQMSSLLQQSIAVQSSLAQSQASLAQQTANLGNAALTTQNQLNYYSAQIEAHARAIVKLNKVLTKLDRLLSQRKLNEYG